MNNSIYCDYIKNRMKEVSITRVDLVNGRNVKNRAKAFRNVDAWIAGSFPHMPEWLEYFCKSLGITKIELVEKFNESVEADNNAIDERNKAAFKPYICAMMERRVPSPIFIGCMTDHLRYIPIPLKFDHCINKEVQYAIIKNIIIDHFANLKGRISGFGSILHYKYQRYYDEPIVELQLFTTNGELIINPDSSLERNQGRPSGLSVKRRKIDLKLYPI